jgi:hypothetical protein
MLGYDPSYMWPNILRRGFSFAVERLDSPEIRLADEYLQLPPGLDRDGLGATVRFFSPRPEQMLERIRKIAFPSSGPVQLVRDGWLYKATFRAM